MDQDFYFKYNIPSFCFLERAQALLERFDNGEVECLFYTAFELRMGIEARLFEYIKSALESEHKPSEEINEYSATKLLGKLARINPEALQPVTCFIKAEEYGPQGVLHFTPVTPELARYHGMLGEFLHFKFFHNNPYWYMKERLDNSNKTKSLYDFRDFLQQVVEELEQATSGSLLTPPSWFIVQVDQLNSEP